jgi:hypothetical protein
VNDWSESPPTATYLTATRHPWPCLLFVLPLLAVYELGVLLLGGTQAMALRNGADAWVRGGLEAFGLNQPWAAPLLVLGVLVIWALQRWGDRPDFGLAGWLGMTLESLAFAVGLWALSRHYGPLIEHAGLTPVSTVAGGSGLSAFAPVITYLGAGIYEELLFRLVGYAGLVALLRLADVPGPIAVVLAVAGSALAFAAAHHIGLHGEPMVPAIFLFRALAGVYFALLFQFRGCGIAVGAHAIYDVFVGVALA